MIYISPFDERNSNITKDTVTNKITERVYVLAYFWTYEPTLFNLFFIKPIFISV